MHETPFTPVLIGGATLVTLACTGSVEATATATGLTLGKWLPAGEGWTSDGANFTDYPAWEAAVVALAAGGAK